jgi:Mrp family chromosome partitioning ATPase/capsular polysaccharide biosynthesis protein
MNETTDAISIFSPLWRRKWLILAVGVVVAAASYLYYKRETPVYKAATQVYLGAGTEELASGGGNAKGQAVDVGNQAAIINSIVVETVRQQLRKEHKGAFLRGAKVQAKAVEKSEFITVTAEAHRAKNAALLANATVQGYIKRQRGEHQRTVERAIAINRRQLRRIEAGSISKIAPKSTASKGKSAVPASPSTANILQIASLNSKINQLESSLAVTGAQQINPAKASTATLVSPKPRKNAIFGFVIGIVLAAIAAYAMGRLDRRLRSLVGIEAVFRSQILAAFPKVRRPIVAPEGQPAPSRLLLEPLRRLHSALQLGVTPEEERQSSSRVILFTSPDAGDGKSTLLADLALVQRDAGERVAVVEANFRRPVQAKLLGLDGAHGLADVLAGTLSVQEAMQRVMPIHASAHPDSGTSAAGVATAVRSPTAGSLFLLAGGTTVPNPPALLASEAMTSLLRSVAEDFDYVLIDAPSPLEVSDVMPLLTMVDGIVIVARVAHTREVSAQRLVQLLAHASRAPLLGSVANCVSRAEAERHGFSAPNGRVRLGRWFGR